MDSSSEPSKGLGHLLSVVIGIVLMTVPIIAVQPTIQHQQLSILLLALDFCCICTNSISKITYCAFLILLDNKFYLCAIMISLDYHILKELLSLDVFSSKLFITTVRDILHVCILTCLKIVSFN